MMKWRAFVEEVEKQLRERGVEDLDRVVFDTIHVGNIGSLTKIIDVSVDFSNAPDEIVVSIS